MERSISNRFYFDYNATSPLSKKVTDFLRSGDFLFGNPASIHTTGKNAKKYVNETRQYLFKKFNLSESEFNLVFHSGATEGINNFFKGNALLDFSNKNKSLFVVSSVDHQAVMALEEDVKILGHDFLVFTVDRNGQFDLDKLILDLNKIKENYFNIYLNFTYVNNETGVVWDLDLASKIKNETGAIVHIDAVQVINKIKNFQNLKHELDAYVFSAHKFGAMKGVGFSFIKKNTPYKNLLTGGNQQNSLRSGTENALAVYSIKLALEDIFESFNPELMLDFKLAIEAELVNANQKVQIVAKNVNRNLNTIFFIVRGAKADTLSMKFDMNGVDLSTGSACSSGIIKENRVLLAMGFSKEEALSCIRLSFGPTIKMSDLEIIIPKIMSVIQ